MRFAKESTKPLLNQLCHCYTLSLDTNRSPGPNKPHACLTSFFTTQFSII